MGLLILDRTVVKAFSRRKPALPVIVLLAIALVGLLAPGAIGQAQEAEGSPPSDYDGDGDGLIEVRNLSQLHAVRWDLNGDGVADHADYISTYTAAFPVADGGSVCPGGTTCTGYELTAELDFDEDGDGQITAADSTYWNGGAGWHPIGPLGVTPGLYGTIENPGSDQPSLFDATFEGNGYTIANLFVKRARSKSVGLFSVLGRGADVKNLELSGVDVEGYYYVGGLGGYSEPNTSITNVQVTGQVVGYYDVGGLIGEIFGSLTRSSADVAVTGNTHVGGLVGENEYSGTISDSFSTGTVTGTYKDAGGLVGYNEGGLTDKKGTIIRSYATGSVTGKTNVGGLVGKNLGYIRASYSMGAVSGVKAVGGLVGFSENGQRVKTSYATGSVSGTSEVGGSVGRTTRGALSGVYYDSDISGAAGAGGKTTAELTTPTGYSSVFASWNLDLDNADSDNDDSTGGDDPWDFGTALQFPALKADFDGDRTATWQEFGEQIREKGSVVLNSTPKQTEKKEPESKVDVDLGQVETGQQIRYTPPPLSKLSGAQGCLIGAGVLYKTVEGKEVVTRSDNGFSLDYSDGLPRLAGRAKFLAAPTTYRIEYICGFPHSWSGSYTLKVEVIGAGMGFGADNLGHVRLYRGQDRTINPPELFFAEGDVSYAISPSLPAGLSIDTSTGVISGAPSAIQDQITYTITATDSKSGGAQTATFDVRLSVKVGMHWPVSNMPDQVFEAGDRIEIVPPALVNPTGKLRYRYRSSHPGLLFLHPYSGTLLASSATPMVKNTYTITAYEDCRCNDRTPQRVNITVNVEVQDVHYLGAGQTVNIPAMALPNLSGNISYALAGTPALPTGLSFNTGTGQISGTLDPNATQPKQTYTITATDANSKTVEYRFKIEVRKLVMSGTEAGYEVGAGYPLSISPTTSGAIGTVSYSISPAASQLPDGVGFNTTTGEISGTPALEFAQKSFTVTATDSGSPPQTADYTVAINVTPSALVPRLTISGGSSVTEGDTAVFTVTATPAPSVWLWVDVTVSQAGDFGVSTGARTVTVPTSGSVTVSVSTADDSADELNGSVSVAVNPGSGYSVSGSQGSAHVAVADNDHHPPLVTSEVSVTGGSGITEGGDASFTVSASPAPSSPLSVSVTVSQVGDFGASTGSRTVTVPTGGTVTLTIATTDDGVDEPNGSVGVAVNSGSGYTVSSSQGSATVNVSDNDVPPASVDGCVEALSGSGSVQGSYGSECGSQARSGRYARFFTFSLSSQAAVRIDLESSLDPYLFLRRGLDQRSSGIVTADDDGGPGLNSRISRTLGAGVYTIEATTYGARRSGLFTLSVSGIPDQGQVQTLPVVSVTGGGGVTEGGDASFTVSASPTPLAPLSVSVTVSQDGDFGAATGSRTVTVPTSGSATVTVGTTDDTTDEVDGSVTVTVNALSGYTVSSSQGSASVSVADNDVPPPST
ncbi:MAG: hypothetical protein F4X21_07065, partial [Acidimicrobiia bacterium]|nr:hypothetical protein [Acidimicrobiia bacterium]